MAARIERARTAKARVREMIIVSDQEAYETVFRATVIEESHVGRGEHVRMEACLGGYGITAR